MNYKHLVVPIGLIGIALAGCSKKKPAPVVEPPPPVIEETRPEPQPEPKVDEEALRRQRIQARIAEVFKPIYFQYDQSTLTPESQAVLQEIGRLMKEVPEISSRVEGHADERGTNEYNLALGERRSIAVQDYLASYGVTKGRLQTISYGEEKPAQMGSDESSWSKNRRVEFTTTF
jgi:peptidoglycan-associated lipoprotein